LDGTLTRNLVFSYNSKALLDDKQCLDISMVEKFGKDNVDQLNGRLVSVNVCMASDIKDIMSCLGGIKVCHTIRR
jgi:cobalamin biosynthesis protein CbiD